MTGRLPEAVKAETVRALEDHAQPRPEGFIYGDPDSRLSAVTCGCGDLLPVTRRSMVLDCWRRHVAERLAAALSAAPQPEPGDPQDGVTQPGPAVDLIEHAAHIIVAKMKEPYTAPYHWAGALWEEGMLVAPGSAPVSVECGGDGCDGCPSCREHAASRNNAEARLEAVKATRDAWATSPNRRVAHPYMRMTLDACIGEIDDALSPAVAPQPEPAEPKRCICDGGVYMAQMPGDWRAFIANPKCQVHGSGGAS